MRNPFQPAAQQMERVQGDEYARNVRRCDILQPAAQLERVQCDGYVGNVPRCDRLQPAAQRMERVQCEYFILRTRGRDSGSWNGCSKGPPPSIPILSLLFRLQREDEIHMRKFRLGGLLFTRASSPPFKSHSNWRCTLSRSLLWRLCTAHRRQFKV